VKQFAIVLFVQLFVSQVFGTANCEQSFKRYRTDRYSFSAEFVETSVLQRLMVQAPLSSIERGLIQSFVPQKTPKTCWASASAIALNAIELRRARLAKFTEEDLISSAPSLVEKERQAHDGMSLDELKERLETKFNVKVSVVRNPSLDEIKKHLARAFSESGPPMVILANFESEHLGMSPGGHYSPIGKPSPDLNSVLVLDVAAHHNPPFWSGLNGLLKAAATVDKVSGKMRGFLIVEER
jgi:hypothetical protein